MTKTRIEAFTDAVIAIVMTLLVLEIDVPDAPTWEAFLAVGHKIMVYVVSFISLAIYWNNHHHMFQIVKKIDGRVLWANNLLIFALSLFPFATAWVGDGLNSWPPQAIYGAVVLLSDFAYFLVAIELVRVNGKDSPIGVLYHRHLKLDFSIGANILGLILGYFVAPILVIVVNAVVLLVWVIPQRKIEKHLEEHYERNEK